MNTKYVDRYLKNLIENLFRKLINFINAKSIMDAELNNVIREVKFYTPLLRDIFSTWVLEIMYMLFLTKKASFNEMKRVLGISSRVLSDKLNILTSYNVINRVVDLNNRPIRIYYRLTDFGEKLALSIIPILLTVKYEFRSGACELL